MTYNTIYIIKGFINILKMFFPFSFESSYPENLIVDNKS